MIVAYPYLILSGRFYFMRRKRGETGIIASSKKEYNYIYGKLFRDEYKKKYQIDNREKIKKRIREYRAKNADVLKAKKKISRIKNAAKNSEYQKKYFQKYYKENANKLRQYQKEFRAKNPIRAKEIHIKANRKYSSRDDIKIKKKNYVYTRMKTDPLFKLTCSLRNLTRSAFKKRSWRKNGGTEKILGVSFDVAKKHIEKQFSKGMSWGNHGMGFGKWNIDHKIPLASAKTEVELRQLCHYTNLQPLWAIDNLRKTSKIFPIQISLTI